MPRLDGRLLEIDNDWEHFFQVVNFLFKFFIGSPFLQIFWQSHTLISVLHDIFFHGSESFNRDFSPSFLLPLIDSFNHIRVKRVQFFKIFQFCFSFDQFWVLLILQSEKVLTLSVDLEELMLNGEFIFESSQSFYGVLGSDVLNHRTVLFIILSEILNILDEVLDGFFQLFEVILLFQLEFFSFNLSLLYECVPVSF